PALGRRWWVAAGGRTTGRPAGSAETGYPTIAASGAAVYVAWEDDRNGNQDVYFNRSLDCGATWLATDVRANAGPAPSGLVSIYSDRYPQLAASGSSVYLTWMDSRGTPVTQASNHVYFTRALDAGLTWLPGDVRVDGGSPLVVSSVPYPMIAAAGPLVYVAWQDARNRWNDIFVNRSLDAGLTWLPTETRIDFGNPA